MDSGLPRALVVLILLAGVLPARTAELDEVQSHLLQQYQLPLRWENIEHAPEWVSGVKPHYSLGAGMHIVRLNPGAEVTFRVPPEAAVRLLSPHGTLDPSDVDVWLSDGSGLWANWPAAPSGDGQSLVRPTEFFD